MLRIAVCCFALLLGSSLFRPALAYEQPQPPIDVQHYGIHLDTIDFERERIAGFCDIRFVAEQQDLAQVTLGLKGLQVRRVRQNKERCGFTHEGDSLRISLARPLDKGQQTTLRVYYGGQPVRPSWFGGFYFEQAIAYNLGVLIEGGFPAFGRAWFPCVDNFTDKATYDFYLDAPKGKRAVASGMFQDSTALPEGGQRYHWRLSQPIPTYLVAIAVGPYAVVRDTCQACSRPIPASLWVRPQDTAKARASFRNLNQGLQAFEKLFGRYPWSRVGYVNVPMGSGAMEHALNIAYPFSAVDGTLGSEDLWAHELSHAWFGNLVTCQGPSHMFLNEGFARYCEILFFEEVYGPERAEAELRAVHAKALKKSHLYDNGYLALDSIPDANTYGPTVYDKGATAVHTLRGQLGDERFFKGLRDYLASYKFGNATVRQFIRAMEQSTGQELGAFYDGFLATPGWPGFALDWTYAGAKAGQHYIEGAVVQHLQAKPRPVQQLELPVLAVSKNGRQRKRFRLRIGGRRTAFSKELPFEPAHLYLDPEQQVLGATLRQLLTPAELEADSLELAALNCELRPGNKPAAAAPLQVNYRYYPPMPQPKQEDQLALLPMAWHIRGPVPAGTRYELRYNTSQAETWLDQLQESRGWFPADDRPGPAEALQLFYRPQAGEPWQLLPQARHKALGNQMHAWQLTPSKRRTGSFAIGVQRPD